MLQRHDIAETKDRIQPSGFPRHHEQESCVKSNRGLRPVYFRKYINLNSQSIDENKKARIS